MIKNLAPILAFLLLPIFIIAQTVNRGPYLQKASSTSMVIKWRTTTSTQSIINYGTSQGSLTSMSSDLSLKTNHEIELSNLNPNTVYYYNIANSSQVLVPGSSDLYFKTYPASGSSEPLRAWILGDCGTGNTDARNVRDAYNALSGSDHTDMILFLGDNAYNDGTDTEYQGAIFQNMYEDNLKNTVSWSCLGNHDGHSTNSVSQTGPYYDIFTFPTSGESGGVASGTEAYYSFDFGDIHFICLESYQTDRSVGGAMYNWCQQDIQNTTAKWIVAYWHHPPYTKGSHDSDNESQLIQMRENFLPLLEANGVDLVLSGHSHSYERSYFLNKHYGQASSFNASNHTVGANGDGDGKKDNNGAYLKSSSGVNEADGAVYITTGSAGKISSGDLNHQAMYYSVSRLGSCILDIQEDTLDVRFLRENGTVEDYFTIQKSDAVAIPDNIAGIVTYDVDCNGSVNGSDYGHPVLKVELYVDGNMNNVAEPIEKVATDITDAYGNYDFNYTSGAGGTYTQRIIQSSDDAEENLSGGSVDLTSTDVEMTRDGGIFQAVGLRFQDLPIPQGANITSAYVQFQARETETGTRVVTIVGEDEDDSMTFSSLTNNITGRTPTTASVNWNIPDWDNNQQGADQRSPDIKSIIQEIVDRSGWLANNNIALIITGNNTSSSDPQRRADSYDNNPGVSPQLNVTWTTTSASGNFIVKLADDNFSGLTVNQTPNQYQGLSQESTHVNQDFLVCGDSPLCYAIADNSNSGPDGVVAFNRVNGETSNVNSSSTTDVESLVFNVDGSALVGVGSGGQLVSIDPITGIYNNYPKTLFQDIMSTQLDFINNSTDEVDTNTGSMDIDGLALRGDGNFWGTIRRSGSDEWDVLVVIDGITGAIKPDFFGTGLDGLALYYSTGTIMRDADDLALDPATGILYVCVNAGSTTEQRVMDVDINTGLIGGVTNLLMTQSGSQLNDVEGFGFTNNGLLYITTGTDGGTSTDDSAYLLDLSTGAATNAVSLATLGSDYEGCDCLSRGVNFQVLPIELISFTGKNQKEDNSTLLEWITASEINNEKFDIMASYDGIKFIQIGSIKAQGDTNSPEQYRYIDNTTSSFNSNRVYYQLKQVDFDGKFSYSNIISINKKYRNEISLFPNPIKRGERLNITGDHLSGFRIVNHLGQEISRQEKTDSSTYISLDTKELDDQIYFIIFDNGQHERLIIN